MAFFLGASTDFLTIASYLVEFRFETGLLVVSILLRVPSILWVVLVVTGSNLEVDLALLVVDVSILLRRPVSILLLTRLGLEDLIFEVLSLLPNLEVVII